MPAIAHPKRHDRYNRRQRKKYYLGEFKELIFGISAQAARPLGTDEEDALIDAFIVECIEPNGMCFGGGFQHGSVFRQGRGSLDASHRAIVETWLKARPELVNVEVGELEDGWYGA
jgi:uncharacterized protein